MKNKITPGVLTPEYRFWTSRRFGQFACLKALALLGVCFSAAPLPAQTPENGPRAIITFADGASVRVRANNRERFRPVEISAGETADIQLRLPPRFVNTVVGVQALDGGLTSGDVVVAEDGRAAIAFQAGVQPGLYRILLSARGRSATLQFWVSPHE